jgi:osmoprotectant transport system substrate-binding protein
MDGTKIVACLSLCLLAGCSGGGGQGQIVVGSKNFSEQVLLGEILAQQIERRLGVKVTRKLNLGGTLLAQGALNSGSIDLYPEYTGTALTAILKQKPLADPNAVMGAVRTGYQQWKLRWLSPLGFNNTFAMMVRGEEARRQKLETLSEAAKLQSWRMGVGYEFKQRPDGLDGLVAAYGLRSANDPVTMDLGLLYAALKTRKVDMIAANSTDGLASVMDVKILQDDKHYFPPYECAVVVREDTLAKFPQLEAALEELAGKLPDAVMRKLNNEVDGSHRDPSEVAADFLKTLVGQALPPGH